MLPSRRLWALTVLAALTCVLGCARPAIAQPLIRSANVSFWATVARTDYPVAPRVYRLYEELPELRVDVGIAHRSFDTVDGTLEPADDSGLVQISQDRGLGWRLRLRRTDAARFSAGVYTIRLSLADAFARLRLPDRTAPRSESTELELTVHVSLPASDAERVQMHRVAAQHALRERRFVDAALVAKRALALVPHDPTATSILSSAYIALDRCPEAAVVLESILPKALGGHSWVPQSLEFAYVCAGDEASATRVMQMRGLRPEQLESTLEDTRRRVRDRLRKDKRDR